MKYLEYIHILKILKNIILNPYEQEIINIIAKKQKRINLIDDQIEIQKIKDDKKNMNDIIDYLTNFDELKDIDREILKKFI